jgi:hypothetical protein
MNNVLNITGIGINAIVFGEQSLTICGIWSRPIPLLKIK